MKNINKNSRVSKNKKIVLSSLLIILFLIIILSLNHKNQKEKISKLSDEYANKNSAYTVKPNDHVLGNPKIAKIILINYGDTECPSCVRKHFDQNLLIQKYGDDVAIVSRFSPPPITKFKNSITEAKAAECASLLKGEEFYWKILNEIYKQSKGDDTLSYEDLIKITESFGLNKMETGNCINQNSDVRKKIEQDIISGTLSDLRVVPTTVLLLPKNRSVTLIEGPTYKRTINLIDAILNK